MFFYKKQFWSVILITFALLISAGCSNGKNSNIIVKIAYQGEVEEAPLLIAYEKGFFKKAGINLKLVNLSYDGIKLGMKSGDISGATFDYRVFNSLETFESIKLVAGLHSGCTQIIINAHSGINSFGDLEGKTIGVTKLGNASMVVTSDLLKSENTSVKWIEESEEKLRELLLKREVDAISILEHPEPLKRKLNPNEKVLFSSSDKKNKGKSYKHFYESFIGFDKNFIKDYRKIAFDTSIAWLKAAQWVSDNQNNAFKTLIDKGYVKNIDTDKTENYMWMPGVKYVKDNIKVYSIQQKSISEKEFLKKVFEPLIPELNGR